MCRRSLTFITLMLSFYVLASRSLAATISTPESITCKCLSSSNRCLEPNASRNFSPINGNSKCSSGFGQCCGETVSDEVVQSDDPLLLGKRIQRDTSSDFNGSDDFYYSDEDVIENADKIFEGFITFVNSSSSEIKDNEEYFPNYYTLPGSMVKDIEVLAAFSNSYLVPEADFAKQPSRNYDFAYDNDSESKTTENNYVDPIPFLNYSSLPGDSFSKQIVGYSDYYSDDDVIENADKIIEGFIIFPNSTSPPDDIGLFDEERQHLPNVPDAGEDVSKAKGKISEEFVISENCNSEPAEDCHHSDDEIENSEKIFDGHIVFKNSTSALENLDEQLSLYNDYYSHDTIGKETEAFHFSETSSNSNTAPENTTIEEQRLIHSSFKSNYVPNYSDKSFIRPEILVNSSWAPESADNKLQLSEINSFNTDDDVIENGAKIFERFIIIKNSSSITETTAYEEQPPEYNNFFTDYDYLQKIVNRSIDEYSISESNSSASKSKIFESSNDDRNDLVVLAVPVIKSEGEDQTTYKQKISRAISNSISLYPSASKYSLNPSSISIYNSSHISFKNVEEPTRVENSTNKLTTLFPNLDLETTNSSRIKFDSEKEFLITADILSTEDSTSETKTTSKFNIYNQVAMPNLFTLEPITGFIKTDTSDSFISSITYKGTEQGFETSTPSFRSTFFNYSKINSEMLPAENCSNAVWNCSNNTTTELDSATQTVEKHNSTSIVRIPSTSNDSFMQRFFNTFFITSNSETAESTFAYDNNSPANIYLMEENNTTVDQSSSLIDINAGNSDNKDGVSSLTDDKASVTFASLPFPDANSKGIDTVAAHFRPMNTKSTTTPMADRRSQIGNKSLENALRTLAPIHISSPFNFTFPVNEEELSTPKPRKIVSFIDWLFGHA